jgi:hypothetical protein
MTAQITPEPTREEREALLRALAAAELAQEGPSGWWEAGIREAVEGDAEGSASVWESLASHGLCRPGAPGAPGAAVRRSR